MTRSCRTTQLLVGLVFVALAAASARADLSASYDGSLTIGGTGVTVAVALDQASIALTGTMAIDAGARDAAGVYFVTGRVRGGKVALTGANAAGTRFRWRARRVAGGNLKGKAVMRGPGGKVVGTLLLVKRHIDPPTSPPVHVRQLVLHRPGHGTRAAADVRGLPRRGRRGAVGGFSRDRERSHRHAAEHGPVHRPQRAGRVAHPAEAARADSARRRPTVEPGERGRADSLAMGELGGHRPAVQLAARVAARADRSGRTPRACLDGRARHAPVGRRARRDRSELELLRHVRRPLPGEPRVSRAREGPLRRCDARPPRGLRG